MEHAAYFDATAGVWTAARLCGDQDAFSLVTRVLDVGRVVVQVAQDKTGFGRQFPQQGWCNFI
jgi:hypothetical protein